MTLTAIVQHLPVLQCINCQNNNTLQHLQVLKCSSCNP